MRRLFPLVVLAALIAVPASAQQATLASPVARTAEHNLRAESLYLTRDAGGRWEVQISVRDSAGVEIRRMAFSGPDAAHPGATVGALVAAYTTPRTDEIGVVPRRLDFRLLGFLKDQGYSPLDTAVLVP